MDFGAHLPLMDFGGHPYTLDHLVEYAAAASSLGFSALSANDHLVFATPWLDGPTALAAVIAASGDMTLATTRCASGRTRPDRPRQGALRDRSVVGRTARGGGRSGVVRAGLRGCRHRLLRAMGAPRRIGAGAACPMASRERAVRRTLVLVGGHRSRAAARAARRTADLDRQLGVGGRPATRGPPRRRLARVRVQHHARRVRRRVAAPASRARRPGTRC